MSRESFGGRHAGGGELPDSDLKYFKPDSWHGQGKLSMMTPRIVDFTRFFEQMFGRGTFDCAEMLCCEVYGFNVVRLPPENIIRSYARRTADEIVQDKTVHAIERDAHGRLPANFPAVDGCQEQSLAAVTVLRAAGFPAAFVRWRHHSVALFRFGDETYLVNRWAMLPSEERTSLVRPIMDAEKRRMSADLRSGLCIVGVDPADVGMSSIKDFWVAMGKTGERLRRQFEEAYAGQLP